METQADSAQATIKGGDFSLLLGAHEASQYGVGKEIKLKWDKGGRKCYTVTCQCHWLLMVQRMALFSGENNDLN